MTEPKRPKIEEGFAPDTAPGAAAPGRLVLRVHVARNDSEVQRLLQVALEEDGLAVRSGDAGALLVEIRAFDPKLPPGPQPDPSVPVVGLVGKTLQDRLRKLENARATMRMLRQARTGHVSLPPARKTRPPTRPGSRATRRTKPPRR